MKVLLAASTLLCGSAVLHGQLLSVEHFRIGPAGVGYTADRTMYLSTTDVFGNPPQNPPPPETGYRAYFGSYSNLDQDMPLIERFGQGNTHLVAQVQAGSLAYFNEAHLKTAGGKLYVRVGGLNVYIPLDLSAEGPFAEYTNGNVIGERSGTLWFSMLMQLEGLRGSGAVQNFVEFLDGHDLNRALNNTTGEWVRNMRQRIRIGQGFNTTVFSVSPPSSVTPASISTSVNLIVLRLDFNPAGNDTMTVYWNPPVAATPPSEPTAVASAHVRKFNVLGIKTQSPDNLGTWFDEFRFGKTWADVVPLASLYTLAATADANGTVQVSPAPTGGSYVENSVVTLTANPNANYRFAGWTGDVPSALVNERAIQITMDSSKTVQANFEAIPSYDLTVEVVPVGSGTVLRDAENPVPENEEVIFTATAAEGFVFQRWEYGDNVSTTPVLLIESTMDLTIRAVFASTELSVSPAAASHSSAGGSGSFAVESVIPVTVSATVGWLSGSVSGSTVNYTVAENPGQLPRSGLLTVSNAGGGMATFAVSQYGAAIFGPPFTTALGSGFHFNFLFEYFYADFYPYIYSFKPGMGWIYIFPADSEELGYFYYDFETGGFYFTSGMIYPDTIGY